MVAVVVALAVGEEVVVDEPRGAAALAAVAVFQIQGDANPEEVEVPNKPCSGS